MSLVFEHASKNPELKGLRGYKYTAEAVYSREWPFEALVSRGIVYDENGNVVAFPFRKFFNYEELFPENGGTEILDKVKFAQEQDIKKFGYTGFIPAFDKKFYVTEKIDGCLGIAFFWNGKWYVKTGGAFDSEQAIWATAYIRNSHIKIEKMNPDFTYCFEVVYAGDQHPLTKYYKEDLYLLGILHKENGKEIPLDELKAESLKIDDNMPKVFEFTSMKDVYKFAKNMPVSSEGVVVTFENGFKCKIKGNEFLKLQRVYHNLDENMLIENLSENGKISKEILMMIPEEMPDLKEKAKDIEAKYANDKNVCIAEGLYIKKQNILRKDAFAIIAKYDKFKKHIGSILGFAYGSEFNLKQFLKEFKKEF